MSARLPLGLLCALGTASPMVAQSSADASTSTVAPTTRSASPSSPDPRGTQRVRLTVATRALRRGDTLRAEDIGVLDTAIVWRWTNTTPDTTRAQVGWITRRPIAAGEVLRYPAVGAPPVVNAGARVSAVYHDGPVRVLVTGIATNSAPLGAAVGVRIDPTRRLDGIAVAPNTVRLR